MIWVGFRAACWFVGWLCTIIVIGLLWANGG
jgi:hypothetical protein